MSFASAMKALAVLAVLAWAYVPTFRDLYEVWTTSAEYSHGILVPFFAAYLLYRRQVNPHPGPAWPLVGSITLLVGIAMRLLGSGTSFLPLEGVSFIVCLVGVVMLLWGRPGLVRFWPGLLFLIFMVPLPYEASRLMGAELQKIATMCSTFVLQCCGLPAISEGNKILIEGVTLNVVEACSGLRMLVTFMAFSVAAALLMERHWVVKFIVLLSAVPIALLTNILRITATGLANVWLQDSAYQAKVLDFIHDFNGWVMMPIGLTFLMIELAVLKRLLVERTAGSSVRATQSRAAAAPGPRTAYAEPIQPPKPAGIKSAHRPRFSVIQMPQN